MLARSRWFSRPSKEEPSQRPDSAHQLKVRPTLVTMGRWRWCSLSETSDCSVTGKPTQCRFLEMSTILELMNSWQRTERLSFGAFRVSLFRGRERGRSLDTLPLPAALCSHRPGRQAPRLLLPPGPLRSPLRGLRPTRLRTADHLFGGALPTRR